MVDVKSRLESIPGYEPGKPAHRMDDVTFMDELEAMWGRRWGAQSGLGQLRTVLFQRPRPARRTEDNADPKFFVNFGSEGDVPDWEKRIIQYDEIRAALESEGVEVLDAEMPDDNRSGIYASEVSVNLEPIIIKGGAIVHRTAIAGKRGQERWVSELLTSLGCPILFTVHGKRHPRNPRKHHLPRPKDLRASYQRAQQSEGTSPGGADSERSGRGGDPRSPPAQLPGQHEPWWVCDGVPSGQHSQHGR